MPWIDQWPLTLYITDIEADCKSLWRDHGIRPWSWRVLVVALYTGVVWEVFTLREDAFCVKFFELDCIVRSQRGVKKKEVEKGQVVNIGVRTLTNLQKRKRNGDMMRLIMLRCFL